MVIELLMTARKDDIKLSRTPQYVSRETGAAELEISPETWDRWVKSGRLPPPAPGSSPDAPRWRWEDVDNRMSGKPVAGTDPVGFWCEVKRYAASSSIPYPPGSVGALVERYVDSHEFKKLSASTQS